MLRMLSFIREFEATCHYACDPKTPFCVKAAVLAALAHCEMPPDVIPDFIVCLGFTDCCRILSRLRCCIATRYRFALEQRRHLFRCP